jgi:hypothetical protein
MRKSKVLHLLSRIYFGHRLQLGMFAASAPARPHLFLDPFSQGTHASAILALLLNNGFDGEASGEAVA